MNITPLHHEPTRFTVQSESQLVCRICNHEFGWPRKSKAPVPLGQCRCPKCKVSDLERPVEPVHYVVDVVAFWGHGNCSCMDYRCRVQPFFEVKDFTPKLCRHLMAAFFLFGQAQARQLGEAPQTV